MTTGNISFIYWGALPVSFRPGETIAAALMRAGVHELGATGTGVQGRYFCGIGNCQACLVSVAGSSPVEACLTPALSGMQISPVWGFPDLAGKAP